MRGLIFDIKEMALSDGPGIRTTVFFKGCPMRCRWCHNPEGLLAKRELLYNKARCIGCGSCDVKCRHPECAAFGKCILSCPENCLKVTGREVDSHVLAGELCENARILGDAFGGFTFSGGEPLFQPEFLHSLAGELDGYHLCIETSGYADKDTFISSAKAMDYVIMDIKLMDDACHKKYTGRSNAPIIENYKSLRKIGKPYLIRTPLIPGITDTDENLSAIKKLIGDDAWELIPYNSLAGAKYPMLGKKYEL